MSSCVLHDTAAAGRPPRFAHLPEPGFAWKLAPQELAPFRLAAVAPASLGPSLSRSR
jgi:hypothetical protein